MFRIQNHAEERMEEHGETEEKEEQFWDDTNIKVEML
jgi:hypothetical protein